MAPRGHHSGSRRNNSKNNTITINKKQLAAGSPIKMAHNLQLQGGHKSGTIITIIPMLTLATIILAITNRVIKTQMRTTRNVTDSALRTLTVSKRTHYAAGARNPRVSAITGVDGKNQLEHPMLSVPMGTGNPRKEM